MDRIDLDIFTAREVAKLLTLVENETRYYQEILALVPSPLAIVRRDLSLSSVNRAFRRSLNLPADDPRRKLDDLLPAAVVKEAVPRALDTNLPQTGIAFTAMDAEGVSRPSRLTVLPVLDRYQAKPTEALVVLEEPDYAGSPAAKVLEELRAAVWRIDAESGEVEFANPGPARLLGTGGVLAWMKRIHPEDQTRTAWVYEAAMESGAEAVVEYRALRADGYVVWLCDRIHPVSRDGKVLALEILTTDETVRRGRVDRLVQVREMEAAMRLSQHVAHEFNNLWMIVNGYTEVLAERIAAGDDDARASLNEIRKAADRGVSTTGQMLQFGRPPASHPQSADLNQLLRDFNLQAELRLHPGVLPVPVDPARLRDAIHTLADYARAKLSSGNSLIVETGRQTLISDFADDFSRGAFATLRLGPVQGISQQWLAHWCEPYFAAGDTSPGIGLAPAFSQLRQMGAWVEAQPVGEGAAAFQLYFPLAAMPQPGGTPVISSPKTAPPTPAPETVLVVDDEESIRNLVTRILVRQGYKVLTAASPEEALRLSDEFAGVIHIAVSDVILPGLRGPQLIERLRQRRPALKVLYISGYTDDPALAAGILPPGEGFLQKPFSLTALAATVRAVLDAPA